MVIVLLLILMWLIFNFEEKITGQTEDKVQMIWK